jgi:predicted nucleic acid-binding protein
MPGTLRLVVDTNLFHECYKLDAPDFPWSAIGDFDAIELIVPDPVQAELDRQRKDTRDLEEVFQRDLAKGMTVRRAKLRYLAATLHQCRTVTRALSR